MKVDIITSGEVGHVLLDGRELDGVIKVIVGVEAGKAPQVLLKLRPDALNVQIDDAQVYATQAEEEKPTKPDKSARQRRKTAADPRGERHG